MDDGKLDFLSPSKNQEMTVYAERILKVCHGMKLHDVMARLLCPLPPKKIMSRLRMLPLTGAAEKSMRDQLIVDIIPGFTDTGEETD